MKISRYLYEKECSNALILLTKTELRVLEKITENGWFDTGEYIRRTAPVFITDNQKEIMKWCPLQDDDPDIADEKNRHRQLIVKKIAKHNKYSV